MNTITIKPIEDSLYQAVMIDLQIGKNTKRVSLELRYMEKANVWFMSLFDLQTEEAYFRNIPLLASYGDRWNNLWKPFAYKNIGVFVCVPKTDSPSTENPSKSNLGEFWLIWGDGLE